MNAVDEVAILDRMWLLSPDQPSELWTAAAQEPLTPPVVAEIEASEEQYAKAHGWLLIEMFGWALLMGVVALAAFIRYTAQ